MAIDRCGLVSQKHHRSCPNFPVKKKRKVQIDGLFATVLQRASQLFFSYTHNYKMSSINNYINGRKLRPRDNSHKAVTGLSKAYSAFQKPDTTVSKPMLSADTSGKKKKTTQKQKQKRKTKTVSNASNGASILHYLKPTTKQKDVNGNASDSNNVNLNRESSLEGKAVTLDQSTHKVTLEPSETEDEDELDYQFCKIKKNHPFVDYWQTVLAEFNSAACMVESPYHSPSLAAADTEAYEETIDQLDLGDTGSKFGAQNKQKRKLTCNESSGFRNVRMRHRGEAITYASVLKCYEDASSDEEEDRDEYLSCPLRRKRTLANTNEFMSRIIEELLPFEDNTWFHL